MEGGETAVIHGNARNNDLIDNLPEDCCLEVTCIVDKNGVQPGKVGRLPTHLAAINQTQINVRKPAVEATLKRDPKLYSRQCVSIR